MNDSRTDSELVIAHLAGDRSALAGIYDRYADSLYDTAASMLHNRDDAADTTQDVFLTAAQQLGQLRDPQRLRPWLFAILRNEVYRSTKRRRRMQPIDFSAPGTAEMAAPTDLHAEGARVAEQELAEMVRSAAYGLDSRDQLVLELSIRQGLTGTDLANVLGVNAQQCHLLVHRMRERVERSLGALTVARMGRKDCDELARLLIDWDGTFSVLIRKRVARHIDDCDLCDHTKRRFAVIPLLSAAPALAAPAGLRERVLGSASASGAPDAGAESTRHHFDHGEGFPKLAQASRRIATVAAIMLLVLAFGSVGAAQWLTDDTDKTKLPLTAEVATTTTRGISTLTISPTVSTSGTDSTVATTAPGTNTVATTAPGGTQTTRAPATVGRLVASTTSLDFGSSETALSLTLSNTGNATLDWQLTGAADPFIWSTTSGSLASGATVEIRLGLDRNAADEGTVTKQFELISSGQGGATVTATTAVGRSPVVTVVRAGSTVTCPWPGDPAIVVTVSDESTLSSVRLSWSGPGRSGSVAMTQLRSGAWTARAAVRHLNGTWRWVVTASDVLGNAGTATGTIVVGGC